LNRGKRDGVELLDDRFNMRGRRDAARHRTVVHVDRPMDIEHRPCMRDLTREQANGDERAAVLDSPPINIRLMLVDIGPEQPLPEPRLRYAGRKRRFAILQAGLVKNADVGFGKASGLQGLYGGVRMRACVVDGNQSFVSHVLPRLCRCTV
jgi:hypothetical protein